MAHTDCIPNFILSLNVFFFKKNSKSKINLISNVLCQLNETMTPQQKWERSILAKYHFDLVHKCYIHKCYIHKYSQMHKCYMYYYYDYDIEDIDIDIYYNSLVFMCIYLFFLKKDFAYICCV